MDLGEAGSRLVFIGKFLILFAVMFYPLFYLAIIMHEFGHAFIANAFGCANVRVGWEQLINPFAGDPWVWSECQGRAADYAKLGAGFVFSLPVAGLVCLGSRRFRKLALVSSILLLSCLSAAMNDFAKIMALLAQDFGIPAAMLFLALYMSAICWVLLRKVWNVKEIRSFKAG